MTGAAHNLYLLCLQGKERGRRFPLVPGQSYIIGRDPGDEGIPISDLLASRRHAELGAREEQATVTDLGSANGTRVNGRPIEEPTDLINGDIITVGHSSFVLEDPRVQSSGDHLSDSTRTHRRRQSQRLKRQLQRHKTVQVNPGSGSQVAANADQSLLADLLAALPLALLIFDQRGHILLANEALRDLVDDESTLPGAAVDPVLSALGDNLLFPEDLETAISSDDPRPMRSELPRNRFWLIWSQHLDDRCLLFILPGEALGGNRL